MEASERPVQKMLGVFCGTGTSRARPEPNRASRLVSPAQSCRCCVMWFAVAYLRTRSGFIKQSGSLGGRNRPDLWSSVTSGGFACLSLLCLCVSLSAQLHQPPLCNCATFCHRVGWRKKTKNTSASLLCMLSDQILWTCVCGYSRVFVFLHIIGLFYVLISKEISSCLVWKGLDGQSMLFSCD